MKNKYIRKTVLFIAAAVLLAIFGFFIYGIYESVTSYSFTGYIKVNGEKYFPREFMYSKKAEKVGEYKKIPIYAVTDDPSHKFLVLEDTDGYEMTLIAESATELISDDDTHGHIDTQGEPTAAFIFHDKTDDSELIQVFARLKNYNYKDKTTVTAETLEGFLPIWIGRKNTPVACENVGFICKINDKWSYAEYRGALRSSGGPITGFELDCSTIPEDYARIISHSDMETIKNLPSFGMDISENTLSLPPS